ncbi:GABRG [Mytilus coruscus]|uniref:GABRG n=1 Tax=Mytilus coruscus TaxID=42192 RepID=A0A6J7ZUM7_MYTCO|nr:GABRG [Mytilus coruscus]
MAETVNGENKSTKPKPKKSVFIKVTFLKISNIETVKEQFSADVFIKARWREPNEERRYPKSDISVVITSEHPIQELEILEDEQELSSMNVSCFVDVQEWELKDFVVTEAKQMTKEFSETKNISFPLLTVKTLAVRQFGFFVWNILIIMTIISLLSFTTFAVDNTKPQNRLQLGFTLTLTGVTFRFVTNQSLPKISYLTKLDVYILFCMIFNFCISIWHAVITRFNDNSDQDSMDFWAFIIFIIIYSVFQLIYFMIVVGSYFWRRSKVQQQEKEYQEKAIKLIGESWKSNRKITSRSKVRDEELCKDVKYTNRFFKVDSTETSFAATDTVFVGSVEVSVNKFMVYQTSWLNKYYIDPMNSIKRGRNSTRNNAAMITTSTVTPSNTNNNTTRNNGNWAYTSTSESLDCCVVQ